MTELSRDTVARIVEGLARLVRDTQMNRLDAIREIAGEESVDNSHGAVNIVRYPMNKDATDGTDSDAS